MENGRVRVAILGPGNIGTDLMYKIKRSRFMEVGLMSGVYETSEGLRLAREEGYDTTANGVQGIIDREDIPIVFEATGAKIHAANAPILEKAGKIAIDLTPAAIGPYVVPCVNLEEHLDKQNVNLVTCGGQATVPIVAAVSRACPVRYAEVVATTSSRSVGPGTRQNIDEYTRTTAKSVSVVGKARESKAIIVLNPADPPITMRNTIYAEVEDPDEGKIIASVKQMVSDIQQYVPGYRLKVEPYMDGDRVVTMIEVMGAGDYLPKHAGNLDIMTAAATAVGEKFAEKILSGRGAAV